METMTDGECDMGTNVTIKDIARESGVSYSTVSRVLSNSPLISEKTKTRVLEVCKEMGYTTNYVARSLVMKHCNLLGIILPSLSNPFMAELADNIEKYARLRQYSIMVCNSNEDPEQEMEVFRLLLGRQVDGIFIFPVDTESGVRFGSLNSKNVPTVFLNDYREDMPGSFITTDNYQGAYMGVQYLHSLGHRNILYFSPKPLRLSHKQRVKGYISACIDLGLVPRLFYEYEGESFSGSVTADLDFGYKMAGNFFREEKYQNFSAVFAWTDMAALGIIKAADERNIRIPEDISLLGFDDISYSALPKINLTTIKQPIEEMASRGVQRLLDMIETGDRTGECLFLAPELIKRKSCIKIEETEL